MLKAHFHKIFVACLTATLSSCVSDTSDNQDTFIRKVQGSGTITLEGWAKVAGEIVIYKDIEALKNDSEFPACISGVFRNHYLKDHSAFDGKRVIVIGKLLKHDSLGFESSPIPRRILEGSVVSNWCYGENVLLLTSVKLMSDK
ncbi:MAG: hypothetical protein DHS20C05_12560 [Hyphococcus sp.]|nr:MAG: hypothetical protein DHS20C05_12560 [Marinicaulis sp.]